MDYKWSLDALYTSLEDEHFLADWKKLEELCARYQERTACLGSAAPAAEIRAVLGECPSAETMVGYLRSVGLDIAQFDALYGREKIDDALRFAKDLKDRFSVLWLYYDLMVSETDV